MTMQWHGTWQMAKLPQPVIPRGCWRGMTTWGATFTFCLLTFAMPLTVQAAPTLTGGSASGQAGTAGTVTVVPLAPVITSTGAATGQVGVAFSYQITASNSPASYNATGLPAGLSVNTATGIISGTPTASGTFSVTLSATNAGGTG